MSAALIFAWKEATKFEGLRSRKSPRRKAFASALTPSLLPLYRVASKACTMWENAPVLCKENDPDDVSTGWVNCVLSPAALQRKTINT